MKQIRVVHLLGSLYPSGMERMLVSAAPYFHQSQVSGVIIAQGDNHPYAQKLRKAGYEVFTVPPVRSIYGAIRLFKLLRLIRPDVVHIHTESGFLFSTLSARLSAAPSLVRTVHNIFRPHGRAYWSRLAQALIADTFVDAFVGPSPDVVENERSFGRNLQLIFNWVADEYYVNAPRGSVVPRAKLAVIVGNCSTVKNHELALHALEEAGYEVAHHGDETNASASEKAILDRLMQQGRLRYRGQDAPFESLSQAAVFAMPSKREGMGVALAEALAMGVPAVVSNAPGLSWADGVAGVDLVELSEISWKNVFPPTGHVVNRSGKRPPDFRAARGAEQYATLYRSVAGSPFARFGRWGRRV